jgi:hypothetical protein
MPGSLRCPMPLTLGHTGCDTARLLTFLRAELT